MQAKIRVDISSQSETIRLGECLGRLVQPGDVIALIGDLGAGKTTLSQAIARGAEVDEPLSSPTFTLIKEYQGKIPVYHMDVYRLGASAPEEDLGFEDYFYGEGVCLIEWAELLLAILPDDVLYVKLSRDGEKRELEAYGTGTRSRTLMKEWESQCRI